MHQSFVYPSPKAGDSGDNAGLNYQALTSDESRQSSLAAKFILSFIFDKSWKPVSLFSLLLVSLDDMIPFWLNARFFCCVQSFYRIKF